MVVGISEGGATRQGLELVRSLADDAYLFHDVSGRTFHPKVYLGESDARTALLIGSHNLSAGGVYFNYEAGLVVSVPAVDVPTEPLIGQVNDWFDQLVGDPNCCVALDAPTLAALVANPTYRIGDEDHRRPASKAEAGAPEEIDSVTGTEDTEPAPLFNKSASAKKQARHNPATQSGGGTPGKGLAAKTSTAAKRTPVPIQPVPKPAPQAPRKMAWSRQLDHTAAQQKKGPTTSLTHNLRLGKARHNIDKNTYWRKDFFSTTVWRADPSKPNEEYTLVDIDVFIYGVPFGTKQFRIDHNLGRVAGQNNVPTVLKWEPMEAYLRANNHVGDWVLLERRTDDTFALRIESQDPGTAP